MPLLTVAASNPGGTGHAWVRERFVKSTAPDRVFIPASYVDNPYLDQEAYSATLDNLLPTERLRIKHGDWDVLDAAALFDRLWFPVVDELPKLPRLTVRAWDTAATPGGGDYSVGLRLHRIGADYYADSMVRGQFSPAELDRIQRQTAESDGPEVMILLEREPGSAGKRVNQFIREQLGDYAVYEESPSGDKYFRATAAARAAANGHVRLVRGNHVGPFLDEVTAFTGKEGVDAHDDIVDAFALAFNFLARRSGMSIA